MMRTKTKRRSARPVKTAPKAKAKQKHKRFANYEHYEADKEKLIEMLLNKAVQLKFSPQQLAQKSGVSLSTIHRWGVTGETKFPRLDTLWRIGRALGFRKFKME